MNNIKEFDKKYREVISNLCTPELFEAIMKDIQALTEPKEEGFTITDYTICSHCAKSVSPSECQDIDNILYHDDKIRIAGFQCAYCDGWIAHPKKLTEPKEEGHTCYNCKHFFHEGPKHDQPYPEFACNKGHFDGVDDTDQLTEENDCKDFQTKSPPPS